MVKNIVKGLVTGVVFIDLRKAFDTVDTDILLNKLKGFGVTHIEHKWFSSYLTCRAQSVSVDGHLSDLFSVNIGVTESCNINMFADDTLKLIQLQNQCVRLNYNPISTVIYAKSNSILILTNLVLM